MSKKWQAFKSYRLVRTKQRQATKKKYPIHYFNTMVREQLELEDILWFFGDNEVVIPIRMEVSNPWYYW